LLISRNKLLETLLLLKDVDVTALSLDTLSDNGDARSFASKSDRLCQQAGEYGDAGDGDHEHHKSGWGSSSYEEAMRAAVTKTSSSLVQSTLSFADTTSNPHHVSTTLTLSPIPTSPSAPSPPPT
jgi:hypothetical protein